MVKQMTIAFRDDEYEEIEKRKIELGMNRHELLKFAVRRFLFPHEKAVPLDGRYAELQNSGIEHVDSRGRLSAVEPDVKIKKGIAPMEGKIKCDQPLRPGEILIYETTIGKEIRDGEKREKMLAEAKKKHLEWCISVFGEEEGKKIHEVVYKKTVGEKEIDQK